MKQLNITQLEYLHCGPIDLNIHSNQCIGLSGASGSGKSQLLRVLADLEPHSGDILLDSINQQSLLAHLWRKQVALLPAETVWWFDTVGEHFGTLSHQQLQPLGFADDISHWQVSRLSSGEKQRLGLLRLLQNQPDVLLLDEPTANLDQANTELFEKFVLQYLTTQSACAIWVSHDISQLQRICSHRYEISNGVLSPC